MSPPSAGRRVMPLARRWLLAGALGVAVAVCWAGRLTPGWLPPPPRLPESADEPEEPPRRRRRVAADSGRGRPLLLFGLPAAGRTALLVRALLDRPAGVTVPRPVTDRPDTTSDPDRLLVQHVPPAQLTADRAAGRVLGVHRRGGHRYGIPLDWHAVVPREAPLRLIKAPLSELARLRRLCTAADTAECTAEGADDRGTEDATDVATEDATDVFTEDATDEATDVATEDATDVATEDATDVATEDATDDSVSHTIASAADATDTATASTPEITDTTVTCSQDVTPTGKSPSTTDAAKDSRAQCTDTSHSDPVDNTTGGTSCAVPSSATRPLLVFIDVSDRSELAVRLCRRDGLSLRAAELRVRAAESELAVALAGDPPQHCFDAVITNDSLHWAADRLVRLVDEQLGDRGARSPTAGEESKMHSARQRLCPSAAAAAAVTAADGDDNYGDD